MPPEIYNHVKAELLSKFSAYFREVAIPIEAPEKADYGDIDFCVSDCISKDVVDALADSLNEIGVMKVGTYGCKRWRRNDAYSYHFLWPWPSASAEVANDVPTVKLDEKSLKRYIQIDIDHYVEPSLYKWKLFVNSHGDLWAILGSVLRPYNITPGEDGLYFRIPGLWDVKSAKGNKLPKEETRVKLTDDPLVALRFLHMDVRYLTKPFETKADLFSFLVSCRFFNAKRFYQVNDKDQKNDKQKFVKRTVFKEFFDKFVPEFIEHQQDLGVDVVTKQSDIVDECARFFGEEWEKRHEVVLTAGKRKLEQEQFWVNVGELVEQIAQDDSVRKGCLVRGIKAFVKGKLMIPAMYVEDFDTAELRGARPSRLYEQGNFDLLIKIIEGLMVHIEVIQKGSDHDNMMQKMREKETAMSRVKGKANTSEALRGNGTVDADSDAGSDCDGSDLRSEISSTVYTNTGKSQTDKINNNF